jgi:hypothetical protein
MSALISIAEQSITDAPINNTLKMFIPLQLYNTIGYTYNYKNSQNITPIDETVSAAINVTALQLTY